MRMTNAVRSARYRAKDIETYRLKKRELTKTPHHRETRRLYMIKWRAANREKHNAYAREYGRKNKQKRSIAARKHRLQKLYGLTPDGYEALLASQSGRCSICATERPVKTRGDIARFHVDHCHATNRVRGILCNKCNTNLGVLEVWYAKHEARIRAYLACQ